MRALSLLWFALTRPSVTWPHSQWHPQQVLYFQCGGASVHYPLNSSPRHLSAPRASCPPPLVIPNNRLETIPLHRCFVRTRDARSNMRHQLLNSLNFLCPDESMAPEPRHISLAPYSLTWCRRNHAHSCILHCAHHRAVERNTTTILRQGNETVNRLVSLSHAKCETGDDTTGTRARPFNRSNWRWQ